MGDFVINYLKVIGAFITVIFTILGLGALMSNGSSTGTGAFGAVFSYIILSIFVALVILAVYVLIVF